MASLRSAPEPLVSSICNPPLGVAVRQNPRGAIEAGAVIKASVAKGGARRQFSEAFKRRAVAKMDGSKSIKQLAAKIGISDSMLHKWERQFANKNEKLDRSRCRKN